MVTLFGEHILQQYSCCHCLVIFVDTFVLVVVGGISISTSTCSCICVL